MMGLIETAAVELDVVRPKLTDGFGHTFITEARIPAPSGRPLILFAHQPVTAHNLDIIHRRLARPTGIVLVRSLPDSVVSLADHIQQTGRSPLDYDIPGLLDGFRDRGSSSRGELYERLIRFSLPWYVRMICSWIHSTLEFPVDVYTFEEHTAHPAVTARNVLRFSGIEMNRDSLAALDDPENIPRVNFNRGLGGRGFAELSRAQLQTIRELVELAGLFDTPLGEYLCCGYSGLPFTVADVVEQKRSGAPGSNPLLQPWPAGDDGPIDRSAPVRNDLILQTP